MLALTHAVEQSLYRRIRYRQFSIPSYVSPECAALINRMLTTDPDKVCNGD